MSGEGWLTIGVTAAVFIALIFNLPGDLLFVGAAVVLTVAGVITPQEALGGFSNSAVVTVGALFVVAAGLRETGALDHLAQRLLGGVRSESGALRRLVCSTVLRSALISLFMFITGPLDGAWERRLPITTLGI